MKSGSNFTRSGITDWLVQRFTAIVLGVYFVVIAGYFVFQSPITFQSWQVFILSVWMKIFTILATASFVAHAWIGLWTVATDYIKRPCWRFLVHALYSFFLIWMLIWCLNTLWG